MPKRDVLSAENIIKTLEKRLKDELTNQFNDPALIVGRMAESAAADILGQQIGMRRDGYRGWQSIDAYAKGTPLYEYFKAKAKDYVEQHKDEIFAEAVASLSKTDLKSFRSEYKRMLEVEVDTLLTARAESDAKALVDRFLGTVEGDT
jgi:hypothetical protein